MYNIFVQRLLFFAVGGLALILILCSGCSQPTAFESLYQMRYQQCLKESQHPQIDCPDSPRYDEYQREYQRRLQSPGVD